MIRKMQRADLDAVAKIWLDANLRAHEFIAPQYWKDHFDGVKGMLLEAELYVYEGEGEIQGFVGLDGGHIAGIFVQYGVQSRGIGRQLLDFVKQGRENLTLSVYQKNRRAVKFYRREGFAVQREQTDEDTGEREYLMRWQQ